MELRLLFVVAHGYCAVNTRAIADQDHLGEYGDVIQGRELSRVKRNVASIARGCIEAVSKCRSFPSGSDPCYDSQVIALDIPNIWKEIL